ncbi:TraB/GumN family protein, partial [Desulfovibrio sp. OttesenSCG-928-M14]|nr:TraB/GumN family protein [Desulfovibrio sp. OttesenSCG-928-M14]
MNDSCDCPPQGDILGRALVPEHSVGFMCAMSGGRSLCVGDFLFFHSDDWLMGIGYPLALEQLCEQADEALLAPKDLADNALAFEAALTLALDKTGARACWAVAPCMPERLTAHVVNEDLFYILPAQAHIPPMLRRHVEAAAKRLNVTEDRLFSAAHRRLWAEQLARADMRPNVRELYARTESALAASRAQEGQSGTGGPLLDLRLLNALNPDGSLAASLLLDYSPERFCSYIIGAHSKENYCPHATDLLFAELLARCRAQGKRFIHMGLGVNQGIARFKRKWGAQPILPYAMAAWEEAPHARQRGQKTGKSRVDPEIGRAVNALLSAPPDISKQRLFDSFPQQRSFAMIYEVRKKNALSYLCGSAHFFRYSFEFAFRDLFAGLHTVIFEGPLDEDFLAAVERSGRNPAADDPRLARCMTETEIARLERVVYGPEGALARLAGQQRPRKIDVRDLLENARPWFAFFSLWVACLERLGWYESV